MDIIRLYFHLLKLIVLFNFTYFAFPNSVTFIYVKDTQAF